jgi:hypothetical protein
MLSVVPTILLYRISFLDLVLPSGLLGDLLYQVCCVGPIEEFSKFLVFMLLAGRFRTVREPVDGMYQAAAVGLGFAIVENFSYGFAYGPFIALLRSLVTPLAHMTYACVWGFVYASHAWGAPEPTVSSRTAVWTAILPAAFLHGFSNYLGNFGPAILVFDVLGAAAAFLVLKRLRAESPFAARDLGRPGEALGAIGASLALDPANPHLHLRAAHFRLRAGDADRAAAQLERYLSARPGDPYGLGLQGAAFMLRGEREAGECLLTRAEAMMRPRTRRVFRTNLRRLLAPGPGRTHGGFDESMLCTWLVVSDLNRERLDPRPQPPSPGRPPARMRAAAGAAAVPRARLTRA